MEQAGVVGDPGTVRGDDRQTVAGPASLRDPAARLQNSIGRPSHSGSGYTNRSNPETRRDNGVLRYDHDAVADKVIIRIKI